MYVMVTQPLRLSINQLNKFTNVFSIEWLLSSWLAKLIVNIDCCLLFQIGHTSIRLIDLYQIDMKKNELDWIQTRLVVACFVRVAFETVYNLSLTLPPTSLPPFSLRWSSDVHFCHWQRSRSIAVICDQRHAPLFDLIIEKHFFKLPFGQQLA